MILIRQMILARVDRSCEGKDVTESGIKPIIGGDQAASRPSPMVSRKHENICLDI